VIWIDGRLEGGDDVPACAAVAPFETIGAVAGELPLWRRHEARLVATARRLGLAYTPPVGLLGAAQRLLLENGHADGVLRWQASPSAAGVATVLATRARSPVRVVRLLPTVVERPANAPPGDVKAMPRRFYDLVRQQAQDGGADDGIVVGPDGSVLEAALGNLWLLRDGQWVTPALDGRVLPGIARARLLELLHQAGRSAVERPCGLGDLHAATALAHSNAVYGPRPARLVGGEAAEALVERDLGARWRAASAAD
jgi:para-aminobenzoate synthetase / 4-amino-4-deoxychorismate lyase